MKAHERKRRKDVQVGVESRTDAEPTTAGSVIWLDPGLPVPVRKFTWSMQEKTPENERKTQQTVNPSESTQ
jgi:hypothetical protein